MNHDDYSFGWKDGYRQAQKDCDDKDNKMFEAGYAEGEYWATRNRRSNAIKGFLYGIFVVTIGSIFGCCLALSVFGIIFK